MKTESNKDNLTPLSDVELMETTGGIFPIIMAAFAIYSGICLVAGAVGYTAGTIVKNTQ